MVCCFVLLDLAKVWSGDCNGWLIRFASIDRNYDLVLP